MVIVNNSYQDNMINTTQNGKYDYRCDNHLLLPYNNTIILKDADDRNTKMINPNISATDAIFTVTTPAPYIPEQDSDDEEEIIYSTISSVYPTPYLTELGDIHRYKNSRKNVNLVFTCSMGTLKYYEIVQREINRVYDWKRKNFYTNNDDITWVRTGQEGLLFDFDTLDKYVRLFLKQFYGVESNEVDELFKDKNQKISWNVIKKSKLSKLPAISEVIMPDNIKGAKVIDKYIDIVEKIEKNQKRSAIFTIPLSEIKGHTKIVLNLDAYNDLYKNVKSKESKMKEKVEKDIKSDFPDELKSEYIEKDREMAKNLKSLAFTSLKSKAFIHFNINLSITYFSLMYKKMVSKKGNEIYNLYTTAEGCESEYIIIPFDEKYINEYNKHYDQILNSEDELLNKGYIRNMRNNRKMFTLMALSKENEIIGVLKMDYHIPSSYVYDKYTEDAFTRCSWEIKNYLDPDNTNIKNGYPLLGNTFYVHLTTVSPNKRGNYTAVMLKFFMFKLIYETRIYTNATHILAHSLNPISKNINEKFGAKFYDADLTAIHFISVLNSYHSTDKIDTIININYDSFLKGLNIIEGKLRECQLSYQKKIENRPKREREEDQEEPGSKRQRTKIFIDLGHFLDGMT